MKNKVKRIIAILINIVTVLFLFGIILWQLNIINRLNESDLLIEIQTI